ncbi:MAG: DUF885 domain-containing protein [Acidimicrobiales bacterium]
MAHEHDLDQVAQRYLEELLALDPIFATYYGARDFDDQLTDFSPDGVTARTNARQALAKATRHIVAKNDAEAVALDSISDYLSLHDELDAAEVFASDLNVIESPLQSIRSIFDLMPRATPEDWAHIAHRMEAVPSSLQGYQTSLEYGRAKQLVAAKRQVREVASQCDHYGGKDQEGFFQSLAAEGARVAPELGEELLASATHASESFLAFGNYLRETYLPSAQEQDGVGELRWKLWCRNFNGEAFDPVDAYAYGWEELHRLTTEMNAIVRELGLAEDLSGTYRALDLDASRTIVGVDAFRDWNQGLLDDTIRVLDGTHFDIPAPVKVVEAMIAPPGGAAAMYYTAPSEDFSRPGRTWYPTLGNTVFPLWHEMSTAYHEGAPGHHLQLAYTTWLGARLNPFQRTLVHYSGHVEGWALYAERLADELGLFPDPAYRLGMYASQVFRTVRVVIDIGLHHGFIIPAAAPLHGGTPWTPEIGVDYLQRFGGLNEAFARSEIDRYLGWPAQATSYKLGERVWLEVRDNVRRSQGAAFSLKGFHMEAFGLGMVSLSQLRNHAFAAGDPTADHSS